MCVFFFIREPRRSSAFRLFVSARARAETFSREFIIARESKRSWVNGGANRLSTRAALCLFGVAAKPLIYVFTVVSAMWRSHFPRAALRVANRTDSVTVPYYGRHARARERGKVKGGAPVRDIGAPEEEEVSAREETTVRTGEARLAPGAGSRPARIYRRTAGKCLECN